MEADLPNEFEYVVVGTGVPESLTAAALSRIGKSVLHIDKNDYYSGLWATFNLNDFIAWVDRMKQQNVAVEDTPNALRDKLHVISPEWEWGEALSQEEEEGEADFGADGLWTQQKLRRLDRQFNIDVIPKFVFAKGQTVDNLLHSDAGRYLEFLPIRRLIATREDWSLLRVPAIRSELFRTRHLQPRQKWQVSSFLQWCMSAERDDPRIAEFECRQLKELLSEWKGMDEFCQQIVINTMGLCRMDILTRPGIERLQHMLSSINRYGPYPLLWPLYGSGELPQAYCRFSAVFGGVYCLGRSVDEVVRAEDGRCREVVLSSGQHITVEKDVVVHSGYLSEAWSDPDSKKRQLIARAIFLTTCQFFRESGDREANDDGRSEDERDISILSLPMAGCEEPALVIELPAEAKACPRGTYLVHMTATISDPQPDVTARSFFEPLSRRLFCCPGEGEVTRPSVLWSAHFFLPDFPRAGSKDCPPNLHLLTGPDNSLDFDSAVNASRQLFERLCPGEEFMPRAPTADEILIEGQEEARREGQEDAGREVQEEAGREVLEEAGREVQEAGREVQEAGREVQEEAGREVQEAGREVQEAGREVQEEAGRDVQEEAGREVQEEEGREVQEAGREVQEEAGREVQEAGREVQEAGREVQEENRGEGGLEEVLRNPGVGEVEQDMGDN